MTMVSDWCSFLHFLHLTFDLHSFFHYLCETLSQISGTSCKFFVHFNDCFSIIFYLLNLLNTFVYLFNCFIHYIKSFFNNLNYFFNGLDSFLNSFINNSYCFSRLCLNYFFNHHNSFFNIYFQRCRKCGHTATVGRGTLKQRGTFWL